MKTLRITNGGPERAKKTEFGGERGEIVQTQNNLEVLCRKVLNRRFERTEPTEVMDLRQKSV